MSAESQIRTQQQPTCMLCGAQGHLLYHNLTDAQYSAPGEWSMRRCENGACGLIWLDPAPHPDEVDKIYASYYTHGGESGINKPLSPGRRFFRAAGKSAIRVGLVRHQESIDEVVDWLDAAGTGCGGNRLLEVGCGSGRFLAGMRRRGWETQGVDTDGRACESARRQHGLNVHHGDLASAAFAEGSFDAITANHAIEHIHDPAAFMAECRRVLRPAGRLALVTPNQESVGHGIFRENWRGLEPPRHLQVFSPRTLHALARNAGFRNVSAHGHAGHSFHFFRDSWRTMNRIGGSSGDSNFSSKRQMSIESGRARAVRFTQALLLQYYELLASSGNGAGGEEAILLCRK